MSDRLHALDALRGAMMLLGIWLHAAVAYSFGGSWPWKQAELSHTLEPSMDIIHIFRMPLFYFLAGFFAALLVEKRGWAGFLRNRALRIALPFILGWPIIFLLVALLAGSGRYGLPVTLELIRSGAVLAYAHPLHLWFLEYLLLLYPFGAAAWLVARALPAGLRRLGNEGFRAVLASPLAPLVLAIPSWCVILAMPRPGLEDPPGFMPVPRILLAYAVPFLVGWWLWANRDLLAALRRHGWLFTLLALIPCAIYIRALPFPVPQPQRFYAIRAVHALAEWLLILGLTGLFLRYLHGFNLWLRNLCNASYFLYLAHMPVLLALQLALAQVALPPWLKAVLACGATIASLLLVDRAWVRGHGLGALLNGRRYPAVVTA